LYWWRLSIFFEIWQRTRLAFQVLNKKYSKFSTAEMPWFAPFPYQTLFLNSLLAWLILYDSYCMSNCMTHTLYDSYTVWLIQYDLDIMSHNYDSLVKSSVGLVILTISHLFNFVYSIRCKLFIFSISPLKMFVLIWIMSHKLWLIIQIKIMTHNLWRNLRYFSFLQTRRK